MSPEKVINIGSFFSLHSLATRAAARTLITELSRSSVPTVLDFQEIESVSRSFVDELNNFLATAKPNVRLINLNCDLEQLLAIVRKTAARKSRLVYDGLSDAELLTL
jgi:hypothetical protein